MLYTKTEITSTDFNFGNNLTKQAVNLYENRNTKFDIVR
jgi:hypothetical protein